MVRDGGVKKKKDPNAPKRPTTAFFMWMQENRERLKKPGMKACDVAKAAGVEWGGLTDKSKWEALADADKKRYETQIAEYRRTHPEPPRQPTTNSTTSHHHQSHHHLAPPTTSSAASSLQQTATSAAPLSYSSFNAHSVMPGSATAQQLATAMHHHALLNPHAAALQQAGVLDHMNLNPAAYSNPHFL